MKALAPVVIAAALTVAVPPTAAWAETTRWSAWERNAFKTATYEAMANGFDVLLYGVVLGGSPWSAPGFFAVNLGTAAVAYYSHEMLWDLGIGLPEEWRDWTLVAKATTYRVVSTTRSYGIGLLFGANATSALIFAAVGNVADTAFYLVNDYAWERYAPLARKTAE